MNLYTIILILGIGISLILIITIATLKLLNKNKKREIYWDDLSEKKYQVLDGNKAEVMLEYRRFVSQINGYGR
ncbi:MAG: hypothetical protein ACTSWX_01415 [Promethearchaeota archaeon]